MKKAGRSAVGSIEKTGVKFILQLEGRNPIGPTAGIQMAKSKIGAGPFNTL
jgi:hypothetical protein